MQYFARKSFGEIYHTKLLLEAETIQKYSFLIFGLFGCSGYVILFLHRFFFFFCKSSQLNSSSVPIVSLASSAVATTEGAAAEIVVIRSGDTGLAVTVTLEAVVAPDALNQALCTFSLKGYVQISLASACSPALSLVF